MKKMNKRGKRILVMVLVFAILCTSLPCTSTIPVHAAQTGKNGSWYEVNSRNPWGQFSSDRRCRNILKSFFVNKWKYMKCIGAIEC